MIREEKLEGGIIEMIIVIGGTEIGTMTEMTDEIEITGTGRIEMIGETEMTGVRETARIVDGGMTVTREKNVRKMATNPTLKKKAEIEKMIVSTNDAGSVLMVVTNDVIETTAMMKTDIEVVETAIEGVSGTDIEIMTVHETMTVAATTMMTIDVVRAEIVMNLTTRLLPETDQKETKTVHLVLVVDHHPLHPPSLVAHPLHPAIVVAEADQGRILHHRVVAHGHPPPAQERQIAIFPVGPRRPSSLEKNQLLPLLLQGQDGIALVVMNVVRSDDDIPCLVGPVLVLDHLPNLEKQRLKLKMYAARRRKD